MQILGEKSQGESGSGVQISGRWNGTHTSKDVEEASPECMEEADATLLASMMIANSGQLLACDTICLYFLVIISNLYEDLPLGNPPEWTIAALISLPSTLLREKLPMTQSNTNKTEPQRPPNDPSSSYSRVLQVHFMAGCLSGGVIHYIIINKHPRMFLLSPLIITPLWLLA